MAVKLGDVFNYPGTESEDGLDTYYRNKGGWHIHLAGIMHGRLANVA
jgi:hypothetical protein